MISKLNCFFKRCDADRQLWQRKSKEKKEKETRIWIDLNELPFNSFSIPIQFWKFLYTTFNWGSLSFKGIISTLVWFVLLTFKIIAVVAALVVCDFFLREIMSTEGRNCLFYYHFFLAPCSLKNAVSLFDHLPPFSKCSQN